MVHAVNPVQTRLQNFGELPIIPRGSDCHKFCMYDSIRHCDSPSPDRYCSFGSKFVLSIPPKHNLQISVCCQSISVPPILVNVLFALVSPEFSEPHYLKQFSCNTNFLALFVFSGLGLISFFVSKNQCTHEMCLTPIDACWQHRASNSTPAAATALNVDLHAAAWRIDLHALGPAAVGCSTAHQGV